MSSETTTAAPRAPAAFPAAVPVNPASAIGDVAAGAADGALGVHDTNAEDIALMRRTAAGDDGAFRELVLRWQNPLINFFYRSTHDRQTSEDLAQGVFIRLYRSAATYEPSAKFSSYLFFIARNLLINEHRRRVRKPADTFDPLAFAPEISSTDESTRRCAEIEEAFAAAVTQLPEKQRTAILLYKQQELAYEDIATAMHTSVTLVKTWIFRGRVRLKELLRDM
jgi:RNA polymerase sigma-70 factor (ECF subfamily)